MPTKPTQRAHPARTLVALALLIIAVYAAVFGGTQKSDATWTPNLALDLEGGTQVILTPTTTTGEAISAESVQQAIEVIRQRIDSSGVAEAEITSQGGQNIVVSIPGDPDPETLKLVRESAQLRFRPVLVVSYEPGATEQTLEQVIDNTTLTTPTDPSDYNWITNEIFGEFLALDCTNPANRVGASGEDPAVPLVACDQNGEAKYILGPVEIEGTEITNASSGLRVLPNGAVSNEWSVSIQFSSTGASQFATSTGRLFQLEEPRRRFAIVLDGLVVMAPGVDGVIPDGRAEIYGSLTRESAATLANQLKFGALPLTFTVQSEEEISATLGTEQLAKGVLAGLIGLVLVVVYSFFQYRALGLVTVGSLLIAGTLTYGVIALLSWLQGYRLSLAGVAGLIVAIGITADSFIVYFERIRDELRDGRTLPAAVEQGWARARRTILASDSVNFLAAVVLYFLAVGGVRGFAFTLGLTTLIDLLVVFTFTHPVMQILAKTKFFGEGHAWSGLDPRRLGATVRYAGRGRVAHPKLERTTAAASPAAVVVADEAELDDEYDADYDDDGIVEDVEVDEVEAAEEVTRPRRPAKERAPLPEPAVAPDGRRLTIAERRALAASQEEGN